MEAIVEALCTPGAACGDAAVKNEKACGGVDLVVSFRDCEAVDTCLGQKVLCES